MKKKKYARPIAILVAVIGAYHVVLFGIHPRLPPAPQTKVIWGNMEKWEPTTLGLKTNDDVLCNIASKHDVDEKSEKSEKIPEVFKRVRFEYRPIADTFVNTGSAAQILMGRGSIISIGKVNFPLKAIRFEKQDSSGKIIMRLMHRDEIGRVVSVSVPVKISSRPNPAIDALWRYLPKGAGEHNALDDLHMDFNDLLPQDRTYFRYQTDKRCEGRLVMLGLQSPIEMSQSQMLKLNKVLSGTASQASI